MTKPGPIVQKTPVGCGDGADARAQDAELPVGLRSRQESIFCIFMLLLAFFFRKHPSIAYPQLFYVFAALLGFNFLFNRFLKQPHASPWISYGAILANGLLIAGAIRCSGGAESYLWVMYLLPIFTACLLLGSRGIWLTTLFVSGLHLGEQAAEFGASGAAGWLQALARAALLILSASIISRLARAEREAKSAAQAQRERLERAFEESASSARAAGAAKNPAEPDAGRLMHEMNSVMTVILGSAQFLLLEHPTDGPMTQDLRRVESATKRLIGIAEKLGSAIEGQEYETGSRGGAIDETLHARDSGARTPSPCRR